jgi:hypothetical protein
MDQLPSSVFGHPWIHSHEEDSSSEMVFRPDTYSFPPSRGRTGFELRPDGSALAIGAAPTDGPEQTEAKWSLQSGNKIQIEVPNTQETRSFDLLSVAPDRLIVRKA